VRATDGGAVLSTNFAQGALTLRAVAVVMSAILELAQRGVRPEFDMVGVLRGKEHKRWHRMGIARSMSALK
jgi:hypothetical protein